MIEPLVAIVPVYNAEQSLVKVVQGVRRNLPTAWIIGVDDGSTDGSRKLLKTVADQTIEFDKNRGKGAALRAAFEAALQKGAAAVLTIDSDGQHDPAFAPTIVGALDRADIVIGTRDLSGKSVPKHRRIANMISSAATRAVSGGKVRDSQSGYRAMKAEVLRKVHAVGDRYEFETDFIIRAARAGFKTVNVPISTIYGSPSYFPRVSRRVARHQSVVAPQGRDLPTLKLLCTNDDGILATGLARLIEAAEPLGEITVVAPDREQSATSHSLTLHHPIRPIERGDRRFQVDGTPTDCVMLAVEALMDERPDFVLSGINHGQNMGEDVLYSGTVAAAMEGLSLGIPSVAVSFAGGDLGVDVSMLKDQIVQLRALLSHIFSLKSFPPNTLLNVNLPPLRGEEIRGVKLTRLGRRVYSDSLKPMQDPWGRQIYWIGGGSIEWSGEATSDFRAIREGYISVTPLHLDLTHHAMLESAERWWQQP